MLFVYLVLLILYISCSIILIITNFSYPTLITQIVGFVAVSRLFLQELSKKYLPLYFWLERQKLRFFSDTTSKWWFQARYDGVESKAIFDNLESKLKTSKFKIKLVGQNNREKNFEIDDTLFISVVYSGGDSFSNDINGESYIDIISKTIEVSYGHAKEKLEKQIEPLLMSLNDIIKPERRSFELNVEFVRKLNPFFNVYIANLSPSQIEDFRVVLHVDGNSPNGLKDIVVISSNKLRITAESTNSFKKLAQDFILLTPDTRLLIGDKNEIL